MTKQTDVPVLFLVFNRPDTTKKVFSEIKKAKPSKLYIAADGPRNSEEKKKTDAVRDYILNNINWKCNVKKLFRDKNLGCKYAVSSAINWFFQNVEEGIILEDDCVPSQSFFPFCREMLEKYKDDERIMQISGLNLEIKSNVDSSYFFSDFFSAWGWATWQRAWKKYDVHMKVYGKIRNNKSLMKNLIREIKYRKTIKIYDLTYKGKIDTWDYQWIFTCDINSGLCIIPKVNLIENVGFNSDATHTKIKNVRVASLERKDINFPLKHPILIINRREYKLKCAKVLNKSLIEKTMYLIEKILKWQKRK